MKPNKSVSVVPVELHATPIAEGRPARIGVWTEAQPGSRWANEGVMRVLGFLVEGAVESGRMRFEVFVLNGLGETVKSDLRSLAAVEGIHWLVHELPPDPSTLKAEQARQATMAQRQAERGSFAGLAARLLSRMPPLVLSPFLALAALLAWPVITLASASSGGLKPARMLQRLSYVGLAAAQPKRLLPAVGRYARMLGGNALATFSRVLSTQLGVADPDLQSASPQAATTFDEQVTRMARWANEEFDLDGWIVLFPFYLGAIQLKKPKAVIFPDALVYDFPLGWVDGPYWLPDGHWPSWQRKCREVFASGGTVITFSQHVAKRHCQDMFGVPQDRLRCIPLAAPDLLPYAPYVSPTNRRGDLQTRKAAAEIIRSFCRSRGMTYLASFPFEEVPFILSATQDRPTKNLGFAAEAVRRLIREEGMGIKMITTASFMFGESWTALPGVVDQEQLQLEVLSIPDVPRDVHAALFHCATLTVHSSFYEGIVGSLPLFEAMSVGCPVVAAGGPHIDELLTSEPELADYVFDPYDIEGLMRLIRSVLSDPETAASRQFAIGERIRQRTWGHAASAYAAAAMGEPAPTEIREHAGERALAAKSYASSSDLKSTRHG